MQLTAMTTHIRLRSAWEAIDLGFLMVQHYWRGFAITWALLLIIITIVVWLALPSDYKELAVLIVWWLKPLYDRLLLHSYSLQLFNQPLDSTLLFKALPYLILHTGLFSALTWRRFSLSRGLTLPIWQLEKLRHQARRERQKLLQLQTHGYAVWLLTVCLHLEGILLLSTYLLIIFFDPTDTSKNFLKEFFTSQHTLEQTYSYWLTLLYLVLYSLTIFIIEPFYIAACFSLYLNRRTQLEAWDIEIVFKNLAQRLKQIQPTVNMATLSLSLIACLGLLTTNQVWAETKDSSEWLAAERLPASKAHAIINEVMQLDEFSQVHTVKQWLPKQKTAEHANTMNEYKTLTDLQRIVAVMIKGFLWLALLALIITVIIYRHQLLAMLKPLRQRQTPINTPDVLLGLDIRPESLPSDIAQASLTLWQQGKARDALSLLYRAALMRLTRYDQLTIQTSCTEGDILQIARQQSLSATRLAWLIAVTQAWQEIAYAHRIPSEAQILPLFAQWPQFAGLAEAKE